MLKQDHTLFPVNALKKTKQLAVQSLLKKGDISYRKASN